MSDPRPRPAAGPDGPWLVIDTATRTSVVALGRLEPMASSLRAVRHRHGSFLLEQVDEVLAAAGASLADVSAIAVGTGPGSFTGLRVGLATAKTIAYAVGLPLVGLRSSDALRRAAVDSAAAPPGRSRSCWQPEPATTTSSGPERTRPSCRRAGSWPPWAGSPP